MVYFAQTKVLKKVVTTSVQMEDSNAKHTGKGSLGLNQKRALIKAKLEYAKQAGNRTAWGNRKHKGNKEINPTLEFRNMRHEHRQPDRETEQVYIHTEVIRDKTQLGQTGMRNKTGIG